MSGLNIQIDKTDHFTLAEGQDLKQLQKRKDLYSELNNRDLAFRLGGHKVLQLHRTRVYFFKQVDKTLIVYNKGDTDKEPVFRAKGSENDLKDLKKLILKRNKSINMKAPLELDFHTDFHRSIIYDGGKKADYTGFRNVFLLFVFLNMIRAFIENDLKNRLHFLRTVS